MRGESLFLTGGAGTGKSFTLNHIVKALKQQRGEGQVFVTASTGIAACHIGGTTLHSFAGVGLARESASDLASRVMGNRTSMRRWTGASVLVIDEVSMLDGTFFDKLEEIARIVRDAPDDEPFGGLQLLLCGDFFQLPPVGLSQHSSLRFLFEAQCWPKVVAHTVVLRQVFRQADAAFVTLLEEMRRGRLSPFHVSLLGRSVRPPGAPPLHPPPPPPPPAAAAVAAAGPAFANAADVSPAGPSPATAAPEAAPEAAVAAPSRLDDQFGDEEAKPDPEATAEAMKVEAKPEVKTEAANAAAADDDDATDVDEAPEVKPEAEARGVKAEVAAEGGGGNGNGGGDAGPSAPPLRLRRSSTRPTTSDAPLMQQRRRRRRRRRRRWRARAPKPPVCTRATTPQSLRTSSGFPSCTAKSTATAPWTAAAWRLRWTTASHRRSCG